MATPSLRKGRKARQRRMRRGETANASQSATTSRMKKAEAPKAASSPRQTRKLRGAPRRQPRNECTARGQCRKQAGAAQEKPSSDSRKLEPRAKTRELQHGHLAPTTRRRRRGTKQHNGESGEGPARAGTRELVHSRLSAGRAEKEGEKDTKQQEGSEAGEGRETERAGETRPGGPERRGRKPGIVRQASARGASRKERPGGGERAASRATVCRREAALRRARRLPCRSRGARREVPPRSAGRTREPAYLERDGGRPQRGGRQATEEWRGREPRPRRRHGSERARRDPQGPCDPRPGGEGRHPGKRESPRGRGCGCRRSQHRQVGGAGRGACRGAESASSRRSEAQRPAPARCVHAQAAPRQAACR